MSLTCNVRLTDLFIAKEVVEYGVAYVMKRYAVPRHTVTNAVGRIESHYGGVLYQRNGKGDVPTTELVDFVKGLDMENIKSFLFNEPLETKDDMVDELVKEDIELDDLGI